MAKSPEQQLAVIAAGVQPHCDEPIEAAMICSRPGAMGAALLNAFSAADAFTSRVNDLPPTVIVAVGASNVYVFGYVPKGFKIKVKDGSEVARWPRSEVRIQAGESGAMTAQFAIVTAAGDVYPFEVTTAMGGKAAYDLFLASFAP